MPPRYFDRKNVHITKVMTDKPVPVDYYVSSVNDYSSKKSTFMKRMMERRATGRPWLFYEVIAMERVYYAFLVKGVTDGSRDGGKGVVKAWAEGKGMEGVCLCGESKQREGGAAIRATYKEEFVGIRCLKYVEVAKRREVDFDLVPEENYR